MFWTNQNHYDVIIYYLSILKNNIKEIFTFACVSSGAYSNFLHCFSLEIGFFSKRKRTKVSKICTSSYKKYAHDLKICNQMFNNFQNHSSEDKWKEQTKKFWDSGNQRWKIKYVWPVSIHDLTHMLLSMNKK